MLNDNVKVTPVFKTKEQEKLFSDCAEESMHKMMNGELPDLLTDEYISLVDVLGFTYDDLVKMNLNAIDKAFISEKEKEELRIIIQNKKA